MKKKSWSESCSLLCNPKKDKKSLKKQRSKARRQSNDCKGFEKTTSAWDLI
jgi:hypothetical protein